MPTTTLVTCSCCNGKGIEPLPAVLEETYAVIGKSFASTSEIVAGLPNPWSFGASAFNNRLTSLKRLGLIESEQRGKTLYWRRIVKAKSKAALIH